MPDLTYLPNATPLQPIYDANHPQPIENITLTANPIPIPSETQKCLNFTWKHSLKSIAAGALVLFGSFLAGGVTLDSVVGAILTGLSAAARYLWLNRC